MQPARSYLGRRPHLVQHLPLSLFELTGAVTIALHTLWDYGAYSARNTVLVDLTCH